MTRRGRWLLGITVFAGAILCTLLFTVLLDRLSSPAGAVIAASPARTGDQRPVTDVDDPYPHCRFGVGATGSISGYDVAALNLGWYVNWTSQMSPSQPSGIEYVQTVRLQQLGTAGWALVSPRPDLLTTTVQANPGATWLIGNEPDSPFQDDMEPQAYIHAYHDMYHRIKGLDPSAAIAIGSIVQPTPLRFQYLNEVWDGYRTAYGERMPVDVWNIHTFILRETIEPPEPEPCQPVSGTLSVWGAYIPPGINASQGELYCVRDQDNLDIFTQRILDFRQWMADRGEREKPLIITEYGVLFPEDYFDEDGYRFSQARVGDFMTRTFEFFLNYTDAEIGYPYDGNRLVQRWAWFSLNTDPTAMGGSLFDSKTKTLRELGEIFQGYVRGLPSTVDLLAVEASAPPLPFSPQGTVTATLSAVVGNTGNISVAGPITITFWAGNSDMADPALIAQSVVSGGLQGCAGHAETSALWPGLDVGVHPFHIRVEGSVTDPSDNNIADGIVLVSGHRSFLPTICKVR